MILIIDTSTDQNQIAKAEKSGKIVKIISWQGQRQSQLLLPKIDQLLKQSQKNLKDLSGILVFSGPGSFTGLRVGIAVANSLGFALEIPVVGISEKRLPQDWQLQDLSRIGFRKLPQKFRPITPFYGQLPKTTCLH